MSSIQLSEYNIEIRKNLELLKFTFTKAIADFFCNTESGDSKCIDRLEELVEETEDAIDYYYAHLDDLILPEDENAKVAAETLVGSLKILREQLLSISKSELTVDIMKERLGKALAEMNKTLKSVPGCDKFLVVSEEFFVNL